MELPSGQSLYSNCSDISVEDVHKLVLMRGLTGIACFALCLTSLLLEVVRMCLARSSTVIQRFFMYVIISNLLRAALLSVDVFTHKEALTVSEGVCATIGFMSQYFASFQLLTITAMMMLLFHNLFTLNVKYRDLSSRLLKRVPRLDILVIVILFLLPSLYVWVPLEIEGGLYGDAGPWCWLKSFVANCTEPKTAFILESVFWNIPFAIVLSFCVVCVTIYLAFFIYISFCKSISQKRVNSMLVNSCVLFVFFGLYTSLCLVEISALMFADKVAKSYSWLVLYAITLPIGEISLSLSSFAHLCRFCKSKKPGRRVRKEVFFRSDVSKLAASVKTSHRYSAKSFTSQQTRPNFLSPSTAEETSFHADSKENYGTITKS